MEIEPPAGGDVPAFPFAENLRAMAADPPRWPDGTRDVAEIALNIRFRPQGFLHRRDAEAVLRPVIVDYPGEWLLDLPLLRRGFADWSADMLAMAGQGARAPLAADWLAFLARHPRMRRTTTPSRQRPASSIASTWRRAGTASAWPISSRAASCSPATGTSRS